MSKSTQPIFTHSPLIGENQVSIANANRDGTGTMAAIVTGDPEGTRIDLVTVKATVTTTAGMIRLFLSDDSGTTKRLLHEIPVTAISASAVIPSFEVEWVPTEPIVLPDENWQLYASTENAEVMNVFAFGGHFA